MWVWLRLLFRLSWISRICSRCSQQFCYKMPCFGNGQKSILFPLPWPSCWACSMCLYFPYCTLSFWGSKCFKRHFLKMPSWKLSAVDWSPICKCFLFYRSVFAWLFVDLCFLFCSLISMLANAWGLCLLFFWLFAHRLEDLPQLIVQVVVITRLKSIDPPVFLSIVTSCLSLLAGVLRKLLFALLGYSAPEQVRETNEPQLESTVVDRAQSRDDNTQQRVSQASESE